MNLDPQLDEIFEYYEAGHMMYIERRSLTKLKDDLRRALFKGR